MHTNTTKAYAAHKKAFQLLKKAFSFKTFCSKPFHSVAVLEK